MEALYLILGLGLIFLAAELFTNAIEWFGKHLRVNEGTIGSVFAAVGTALPETSVPLVAFISGGASNEEAGIGAIVGAPMMLSTLAMFVTGVAVLVFAAQKRRSKQITADYKVVGRDLRWFFLVYLMALGAALIPPAYRPAKLAIAGILILGYGYYVYLTVTCKDCEHQESEMRPLHFHRKAQHPKLRVVLVQLLSSLALIVFGARMFVDGVSGVSPKIGISALVLSVIITPIATELPEKFNSMTWMRHKKDTLALGNITGAMVFQSSVLPAIGIICTGWGIKELGPAGIGSIVVALIGSSILWADMTFKKRLSPYALLLGGATYLLFPIYFFGILHGKHMSAMRQIIGIDISTQTVTAMLIGVAEEDGSPAELVVSSAWTESRPCRDEIGRKNPAVWVELVRECIAGLTKTAIEAHLAEAIGVSTTFPGCFAVLADGSVDPRLASLYDNTDDAGACAGEFDGALGRAESETLNRMWPGNMAIGLAHLVKSEGLRLQDVAKTVPANTAFAYELLNAAGFRPDPDALFSDFTQTAISGLYDARSGEPVPAAVADLLSRAAPEIEPDQLRTLLPSGGPAWRNAVPAEALGAVRELLGLPKLASVSIGAGDSLLGTLALMGDRDTVINVRGSSDSPAILVDAPKPCAGPRETVLHFPLPTATCLSDAPWCVVAPMLRSGRVWDWVRNLRFAEGDPEADAKLEALALDALTSRRGGSPCPPTFGRHGDRPLRAGGVDGPPLRFDTALGGERAPEWDAQATGSIVGLVESHGIGDIALAALEGMSSTLSECIKLMESRYGIQTSKLLLAGGPARNKLWNWITQAGTGKQTFATTFSDASLLGAALLGYGTLYDGSEADQQIAQRLLALSRLSSSHPLVAPVQTELSGL